MYKYKLGQKVKLCNIDAKVGLVGADGSAYLLPLVYDVMYNNFPTWQHLVFAVIDTKGYDKLGNKAKVYKWK